VFVWIDIITRRSVGFGSVESSDPALLSKEIDTKTYHDLLQDPNKLRWGRLVETADGHELCFKTPAPFSHGRWYSKLPVTFHLSFSELKATDVDLKLDVDSKLTVDCPFDLPNNYLTVCPGSVFFPSLCQKVTLGVQNALDLRRALFKNPRSQVFLSGILSDWSTALRVQTPSKGH
jgi:hypothetical protein